MAGENYIDTLKVGGQDIPIRDTEAQEQLGVQEGELSTLKSALNTLTDRSPKLLDDDSDADLDVADINGNVVARFANGQFETKNFQGFDYKLYASSAITYTGAACTLTVAHAFAAGDRIVLHVERGAKPWDYGGTVVYKADNKVLFNGRGDNAYLEYTLTEDADEITAVYGASATGVASGDSMVLEVYLLGDVAIRPTVVTIKQDGTGDYTTFRAAMESIGTKADDVIHPYRIEVYPGTYNVMDDYTQEEINAAAYTQTGFVGPRLYNGMTLVGIGENDKIIINGELSTSTYSAEVRKLISTLNLQGSCNLENLTIRATNLRYTIHDDFHSTDAKPAERHVKDCIFEGFGAMTYTYPCTWGAGMSRAGTNMLFENCAFNGEVGIHTQNSLLNHPVIRFFNCSAGRIAIGDLEINNDASAITRFYFENCDIGEFNSGTWQLEPEQYLISHVAIYGHGGRSALYNVPAICYYNTGDCTKGRQHGANLAVGDAAMYARPSDRAIGWAKSTSFDVARGVVIWAENDEYIVQTSGFVLCERVGITQYQYGDYVGVDDNGKLAVVQDASTAIGRVLYTLTNKGFIELDWRHV